MKSKNTSKNRRKLLKSIAAGSGVVVAGKSLPDNWSRPVVDSVMLPAHAQTSGSYSGSATVQGTIGMLESDSLIAQAVDSMVPEAAAFLGTYKASWCIIPVSDTQADVTFLVHGDLGTPPFAYLDTGTATVGETAVRSQSHGCSNAADAGYWLNHRGLVKEAKATCGANLKLSGLRPGNSFTFETDCEPVLVSGSLETGSSCPSAIVSGDQH